MPARDASLIDFGRLDATSLAFSWCSKARAHSWRRWDLEIDHRQLGVRLCFPDGGIDLLNYPREAMDDVVIGERYRL